MKPTHSGSELKPKKTIAVGFGDKSVSVEHIKRDLVELEELIYSLGWEVVGSTFQKAESIKSGTLVGSGKVQEIKDLIDETGADCVVFDHTLTGSQLRNLTKDLDVIIADRNQVIIDIFAKRAQTKEGKLQVELARLVDELPRMIGGWHGSLSRLAGGIGTRGPGESALEKDRRTIRNRIALIRNQLKTVEKHRKETKKNRDGVLKIALLGYTNAGKSSLLEVLSGTKTFVEDQLFATLDPVTRKIFIKDLGEVVLTDTVGFINKIPTHLIDAFKATLEESSDADIILHVVDTSDPDFEERIDFIKSLIKDFGWNNKKVIYVYNKIDLLDARGKIFKKINPFALVSAKNQEGINTLKNLIRDINEDNLTLIELFIPNKESFLIEKIQETGNIITNEASSLGNVITVEIQPNKLVKWEKYRT